MKESILNHSRLEELKINRHRLSTKQQELLDVALQREEESEYRQRQRQQVEEARSDASREHVDWSLSARCGIILMSSSERARSFVYCGYGNQTNKRGLCHHYRYCPICNWVYKAKPTIAEFTPEESFYRAGWAFLSISFTTNPENAGCVFVDDAKNHFDPAQSPCVYDVLGKYDSCPLPLNDDPASEEEKYVACWNAGHVAVKTLKKSKIIRCYLGNDDLAIRFNTQINGAFTPCGGLPHTHYIVSFPPGDTLNTSVMEDLAKTVEEFLREECPQLELYVTVHGFGIQEPETLSRLIRYVVKPIDFTEAYGMALFCSESKLPDGRKNPEFMARLNVGVDYLFDAFENGLFYRRRGVRRGGNLLCDSRTDYIGTKKINPARRKRSAKRKTTMAAKIKKAKQRILDNPNYEF